MSAMLVALHATEKVGSVVLLGPCAGMSFLPFPEAMLLFHHNSAGSNSNKLIQEALQAVLQRSTTRSVTNRIKRTSTNLRIDKQR
jgi:hypothetical protein